MILQKDIFYHIISMTGIIRYYISLEKKNFGEKTWEKTRSHFSGLSHCIRYDYL